MHTSHWSKTARLPRFPQLNRDLTVDVVVVGGGITGATAAYLVKQAGLTVALLEKDRCGTKDTCATTAHLTYVTDLRLSTLVRRFGQDHAQAAWDAGQAALDQIRKIVETEALDCELHWVPGYLHAPLDANPRDQRRGLRQDARRAAQMGFSATYLDAVPLVNRPGVRFGNQARFHPLKYLSGLLQKIDGQGSFVFERTEAEHFDEKPLAVRAKGGCLRCGYVVIATHVPLMGQANLLGATLFQSKLAPYTSYAVAARLPDATAPDAIFWDTADPYHYLRIEGLRGRSYAILGGEDHKTGQEPHTEERYGRLERLLTSLWPDAEFAERWSGQVIETNDGLPFIGETAKCQFIATGFSGNGMTFGTLAGIMARDAVLQEGNPWRELFHPGRKKLKGGAWNYVKENLDYPYYMLKDRLVSAESKSLRSVRCGQGKILSLDGKRTAVYRDQEGKVSKLSPICTHMGCIVHWNEAERTWDCPCHGSRFGPTGEVLAGPAESPLAHQKVEREPALR